MVMVEKEVLHSAASSAFAASRASLLRMPTRALQAVSFNRAPSARFIWSATLDDLREAVTTLEEIGRTARRVFGGAHPLTTGIEDALGKSRAKLRARETPSPRE